MSRVLRYAFLVGWACVCLFPVYWLGITSIKSVADIDKPPGYVPFVDFIPSLDAWRFILSDPYENLLGALANSLLVGCSAAIVTSLLAVLVLYGVTRWPAPPMAVGAMLATRCLSPVALALPLYIVALRTGAYDTRWGLILVYSAINLPVAIWILLPVIGGRATDQEEAALLDGATHLTIVFDVLLPMIRRTLVAAGLLIFLLCWNEYLFAAYLSSRSAATLPIWMAGQLSMKEAQAGGEAEELAHMSAAAIFMTVPALLLAAFAMRAIGQASTVRRS